MSEFAPYEAGQEVLAAVTENILGWRCELDQILDQKYVLILTFDNQIRALTIYR